MQNSAYAGGSKLCRSHPPQGVSTEMLTFLSTLRSKVHIGMVGGSDLVKQREQLGEGGA